MARLTLAHFLQEGLLGHARVSAKARSLRLRAASTTHALDGDWRIAVGTRAAASTAAAKLVWPSARAGASMPAGGATGEDDKLAAARRAWVLTDRRTKPLPYMTPENLPGIGGMLKAENAHFVVTERRDGRALSGTGEHIYVTLQREGMSTLELRRLLAQSAGVDEPRIGYAGLKDKDAVTTQTFSVPEMCAFPIATSGVVGEAGGDSVADRDVVAGGGASFGLERRRVTPAELQEHLKASLPGVNVLFAGAHDSKLRRGDLAGNDFDVLVTSCHVESAEALRRAEAIAASLRRTGWPNYFGKQRFGKRGDGHVRGMALMATAMGDGTASRHKRTKILRSPTARLTINGLQSMLYNEYLARRVVGGGFPAVFGGCGDSIGPCPGAIVGDVLLHHDGSWSHFEAQASGEDGESGLKATECSGGPGCGEGGKSRRCAGDVASFSGPIFGEGMVQPKAGTSAAALEEDVLAQAGLTLEAFCSIKMEGSRRACRLRLDDDRVCLTIEAAGAHALRFRFFLPRGSYATVLLREFMKLVPGEGWEVEQG